MLTTLKSTKPSEASVVDLIVKVPGVSNERKMLQLLHVDVENYTLEETNRSQTCRLGGTSRHA